MPRKLKLSREQILNFRRRAGSLDERLPNGEASLRRAAWAGLQDSMPRAALLSIHARVAGTVSADWEHRSLVQLWGPRFNTYAVAAEDLAAFTLGRMPQTAAGIARATHTAGMLHAFLDGGRMPFGKAGHAMGLPPNSLRYAAATGRVLIRWDGARQPTVWTVPPPPVEPHQARLELARRYLNIFAPATAAEFARWAGIELRAAYAAFKSLEPALIPAQSPDTGRILAADEELLRAKPGRPAPARLLPSGDAYYLAWGSSRELLVPDARQRQELWTSRVWPGALLVGGEIAGVWRRAGGAISIHPWRKLSKAEREAVENEALSLPLPGIDVPATIGWD